MAKTLLEKNQAQNAQIKLRPARPAAMGLTTRAVDMAF